jgi:uncharacterized protein (TIGR02284 family)
MRTPTATLPELVEALNDGMDYLYLAAERSHHPARVQLFHRIRRLKADIAADLASGCVGPLHPVPEDGSWLAAWRDACSGLPATLAHGPDRAMLTALDAQELRLLRAFRDAIGKDQPPALRELAATHLPEVEEARDELHELKSTTVMAAAARKRPAASLAGRLLLRTPDDTHNGVRFTS